MNNRRKALRLNLTPPKKKKGFQTDPDSIKDHKLSLSSPGQPLNCDVLAQIIQSSPDELPFLCKGHI